MLWDASLIARLLQLYKENRVLWDQRHHNYTDKNIKQMALQGIQEELGIPVSPNDIHRKYRTMRAAYQVEVRNINAAKLRGFFYKPTLHWFDIFHKFMEETKEIKAEEKSKEEKLVRKPAMRVEGESSFPPVGKKYVVVREEKETVAKRRRPVEVARSQPLLAVQPSEESRESSEVEYSSEESEDEFQTFADHIAEQLRTMSVHRAVMIQNQIQRLFAKDREANSDDFLIG